MSSRHYTPFFFSSQLMCYPYVLSSKCMYCVLLYLQFVNKGLFWEVHSLLSSLWTLPFHLFIHSLQYAIKSLYVYKYTGWYGGTEGAHWVKFCIPYWMGWNVPGFKCSNPIACRSTKVVIGKRLWWSPLSPRPSAPLFSFIITSLGVHVHRLQHQLPVVPPPSHLLAHFFPSPLRKAGQVVSFCL